MNPICFFFLLVSGAYCMLYLPNERIINLTLDSDFGYIYLNKTDFSSNSNIYISFRIIKGTMDNKIYFGLTNTHPISDDQIPNLNEQENYKIEEENNITTYSFEISQFSEKYCIIKYSSFSGNSLSVGASSFKVTARYVQRGEINFPSTPEKGFIYLKYEDFPDFDDLYIYFKIKNGDINNILQYQETNIDPSFIVSFSSPKDKNSDIRNSLYQDYKAYAFSFSKTDYKYIIIYYSSLYGETITLSSSTKIKYLSKGDMLIFSYNYGFVYLDLLDFKDDSDIYMLLDFYLGSMNNYIEYTYHDKEPIYEEEFNSFNNKTCDLSQEPKLCFLEFPSKIDHNRYLIIKYSNFLGENIEVLNPTKMLFFSKDDTLKISNTTFRYLYLKFEDFTSLDNGRSFYLYFELSDGDMNEQLSYGYIDKKPIYESQYYFATSQRPKFKTENPKSYLYEFGKLNYIYMMFFFWNFTGESLTISSLTVNPISSLLTKDQPKSLSTESKSGFLHIDCGQFENEDTIYIYFEIDRGNIGSKLNYTSTNQEPGLVPISSSFEQKNLDKREVFSIPYTYSFKFDKPQNRYLLIKYSGFIGDSLKVTCSNKDPLSTTKIVEAVSISAAVIAFIAIFICANFCGKKQKIKIEPKETNQQNNSDHSNQAMPLLPQDNNSESQSNNPGN